MADANAKISNFLDDLNNLPDIYMPRVVLPYTRAFDTAYASFHKTLGAQAAANKATMELALTALSLAGGALVTRVFAGAALKSVAKNAAVNFICDHNLERAFKAAAMVESSPVASYIVGTLWDQGQKYISDNAKKAFELNATNFEALSKFTTSPTSARTYIEQFVYESKTKAYAVAKDLRDSSLPDGEKLDALNKLKGSQFCKEPQTLDEGQAAIDIELTWWMNYMLGLDQVRILQGTKVVSASAYGPVTENPSSTRYPRYRQPPRSRQPVPVPQDNRFIEFRGLNFGERTMQRIDPNAWYQVRYEQLGWWHSEIRARIDTVYKARMGKVFFDQDKIDRSTLVRAELTLNVIGNHNLAQLQTRIKAP